VLVLWATSFPGLDLVPAAIGGLGLAAAAGVWCVRLVAFVAARRTGHATGSLRPFLLAPLGALLLLVLLVEHVPLRVRWAASRDAFEATMRTLDGTAQGLPADIGWYRVTRVIRHGDAVLFSEDHVGILDDTGFAYLPDGPVDDLPLVRPRFVHLGDDWYSFTASW
jgi:hypothetical protein